MLARSDVRRAAGAVPFWAIQLVLGLVLVVVALTVFVAVIGSIVRGPTAFFDDVGRTVARIIPQPQADLRTDAQLKAVIAAMPEGRLRLGAIVEDQDRVVFTISTDRSAVHVLARAGDELRIGKDGNVEVVPTGVPGLLDQLQRALERLLRR